MSNQTPTLARLVELFPVGPWAGDARLAEELAHLAFMNRLVAAFAQRSDPSKNFYLVTARELGLTKHSEILIDPKAEIATAEMTPEQLTELYFCQQVSVGDTRDDYLPLENEMAMMMVRMAVKLENEELLSKVAMPGLKVYHTIHQQLCHTIIGLAVQRAMPDVPMAALYLNWTIVRGAMVYICSYNQVGKNDTDSYPVGADGIRLGKGEAHAAIRKDARIESAPDDDDEEAQAEFVKRAKSDPTIVYQL